MLKSLQKALFVFSLLMVASRAFAVKANLEDCPCWDAMIEAVATTECTAYDNSERHTIKLGIFEKTLSFGESTGGDCASIWLSNKPDEWSGMKCRVDFGREDVDGCFLLKAYIGDTNLNAVQVKACDAAMKGLKREINKLPDCYVGCPSPCDGGD